MEKWDVRSLSERHAFVVDAQTGRPACGHAHREAVLQAWHASGDAARRGAPCPACPPSQQLQLQLLGDPTDPPAAAGDAPIVRGAKGHSAEFIAALIRATPEERRRMLPPPASADDDGRASFLAGLQETDPKVIRLGITGGGKFKPSQKGRGTDGNKWSSKQGMIARIMAELFGDGWDTVDYPARPAAKRPARDPPPGGGAGAAGGAAPRAKRPATAGPPSAPVVVEARPAVGRDTFFTQLANLTDKDDMNFFVYGRDRCEETVLKDIGVATLASYQHVVLWAATRIAQGSKQAHSLLLYHPTGAGKTVSLWLALGAFWGTKEVYRKNFWFVSKASLAANRQPDKDVWAFYTGAGEGAHAEVHSTVSLEAFFATKQKGKGKDVRRKVSSSSSSSAAARRPEGQWKFNNANMWRYYMPAGAIKARTRVMSFREFANALLGKSDRGRAMYGVALARSGIPPTDQLNSRMLDLNTSKRKPFKMRDIPAAFPTADALAAAARARAVAADRAASEAGKQKGAAALREAANEAAKAAARPHDAFDPLRDAVVVFDEADLLFNRAGELGADGAAEMIERAIFHSYAVSGDSAVHVILATATPAHTTVEVTFRLLNLLITDSSKRVSDVGSGGGAGGGASGASGPTVATLRGTGEGPPFATREMQEYMAAVKSSISRVDLSHDADHFPKRMRHTVLVEPHPAHVTTYLDAAKRRFPLSREDEQATTSQDNRWDELQSAMPRFEEDDEAAAAEAAATRAAKTLAGRVNALRRSVNMLPRPGDDVSAFPDSFLLGNPAFDADAFIVHINDDVEEDVDYLRDPATRAPPADADVAVIEVDAAAGTGGGVPRSVAHIRDVARKAETVANGRSPKLMALLRTIRAIDYDARLKNKPFPKHAILCSTPGAFGAPLVAAALAVAGYRWRAFERVPGGSGDNSIRFSGAVRRADGSTKWEAARRVDSRADVRPGAGVIAAADQFGRRPHDFVVMDATLIPLNPGASGGAAAAAAAAAGGGSGSSSFGRVYSDYQVSGQKAIAKIVRDHLSKSRQTASYLSGFEYTLANDDNFKARFRTAARSLLYVNDTRFPATSSTLYPHFYLRDTDTLEFYLREMLDYMSPDPLVRKTEWTLDELRAIGFVRWAPRLSPTQKSAVTRNLTRHFNDAAENGYGEFARIVVVSPDFTTGLDLFNVEHLHLFDALERVPDDADADGVPRTRDRIQSEGRAWRRCGHSLLRQRSLRQRQTKLHVYEYRLDLASTVEAERALRVARNLRPVRRVAAAPAPAHSLFTDTDTDPDPDPDPDPDDDEHDAATMAWFDTLGDNAGQTHLHIDDLISVLRRDPVEQTLLSALDDALASHAFDRVQNAVQTYSDPLYTGYVYAPQRIAVYRNPATRALVTVDGSDWKLPGQFTGLADLWENSLLRWDVAAGTWRGVADVEQLDIERMAVAAVGRQLDSVIELAESDGAGAADIDIDDDVADVVVIDVDAGGARATGDESESEFESESRADAAAARWRARARAVAPFHIPPSTAALTGERRTWYDRAAVGTRRVAAAVGIVLQTRDARDLWLASHVTDGTKKDVPDNFATELIAAWKRHATVATWHDSDSSASDPDDVPLSAAAAAAAAAAGAAPQQRSEFLVAEYIRDAFGVRAPQVARGTPIGLLRIVLDLARWLDIADLREALSAYADDHGWGFGREAVIRAIAKHPHTPGELPADRRVAVFYDLTASASRLQRNKWPVLMNSAARVFGGGRSRDGTRLVLPDDLRRSLALHVERYRQRALPERGGAAAAAAAAAPGDVYVNVLAKFAASVLASHDLTHEASPTVLYGQIRTVAARARMKRHEAGMMGAAIQYDYDAARASGGSSSSAARTDADLGGRAVAHALDALDARVNGDAHALAAFAALTGELAGTMATDTAEARVRVGGALYAVVGDWTRVAKVLKDRMTEKLRHTGLEIAHGGKRFPGGRGAALDARAAEYGLGRGDKLVYIARTVDAEGVPRLVSTDVTRTPKASWHEDIARWLAKGQIIIKDWSLAETALGTVGDTPMVLVAASGAVAARIRHMLLSAPLELDAAEIKKQSVARAIDWAVPFVLDAARRRRRRRRRPSAAAAAAAAGEEEEAEEDDDGPFKRGHIDKELEERREVYHSGVDTSLPALERAKDFLWAIRRAGEAWDDAVAFARMAAAVLPGIEAGVFMRFFHGGTEQTRRVVVEYDNADLRRVADNIMLAEDAITNTGVYTWGVKKLRGIARATSPRDDGIESEDVLVWALLRGVPLPATDMEFYALMPTGAKISAEIRAVADQRRADAAKRAGDKRPAAVAAGTVIEDLVAAVDAARPRADAPPSAAAAAAAAASAGKEEEDEDEDDDTDYATEQDEPAAAVGET